MKLSFENRIPRWDEGLPLGNGILGALVWGEADDFRISLNRADLWGLRRSDTFSSPKFNYREYVRLARAGKAHPSLWYRPDLFLNPRRLFYLVMHGRNHYGKFKKYYGKE